jgi:kynurenine formamidase
MSDTNDIDDTGDTTEGNHGGDCGCETDAPAGTGTEIGRRTFVGGCGATLAFALAGTTVETAAAQEAGDIAALLDDLPSNWGRWGDDDELGALNSLGSEEAFEGMRAATKRGRNGIERFTLQLSVTGEVINPDPDQPGEIFPPEEGEGPMFPSSDTGDPAFPPRTPGRRNNTTPAGGAENAGGMKFVDDKFVSDLFLQGTTHLDALGHAWYGEQIYNGFDASSTEETKEFDTPLLGTPGTDAVPDNGDSEELEPVSETKGLGKASISEPASAGIAGRAVLLDVGREFGDEDGRLPLEACITYDDLVATAESQGVEIRERDLFLIRTGAIARTRDPDAEWGPLIEPGLCFSEDLVNWMADMEIPYVGADNLAVEKVTQVIDGETYVIPLHGAFLRNLGVYINEILWLEDLAEQCAADGIYDFLFTAAPIDIERSSGAPINPVVLKATDGSDGDDTDAEADEGEKDDDSDGGDDEDEKDGKPDK